MAGVLARTKASCLVRLLVLQSLHAAHDRHHDVVVGVRHAAGAVEAHAWLEGERTTAALSSWCGIPPVSVGSPSEPSPRA